MRGGQRRGHRGVDASVGHLLGGIGIGIRGPQFGVGQVGGHPLPHLGRRDAEGRERPHVRGAAAGFDDDAERDVQRGFGEYLQG